MAKHQSLEAGVEDGSWFLEAIGEKPAPPKTRETLAGLERENALPESPVSNEDLDIVSVGQNHRTGTADFSGDPGTSTSSFDPIPDMPPTPPGLLDTSGSTANQRDDGDGKGVDDALLPKALRTKRRFRWPTIVSLALLAAGVAAALFWFPNVQQQQALTIRQNNYDAAYAIRTQLSAAQASLDAVTDPNTSDSDVVTVVSIVSSLSSDAASLAKAASEPLPVAMPFLSPASMQNLETFTEQSVFLAADTAEIARRLNRSYVYRTSVPTLLSLEELPSVASAADISVIAVTTASALARDAGVIAELPDDAAFDATLTLASNVMERFSAWQGDYLGALRAQDEESASRSLLTLDAMRSEMAEALQADLAGFRTELDSRIVDLATSLDNHLENLSR